MTRTEMRAPAFQPGLVRLLAAVALLGCVLLGLSVLVADVIVPDHNWIADTISDLGAGRYEFIVDTGIYAFSAALIAVALAAAHLHPGGRGWSVGLVAFALAGLIVFLVGARNEYGDADSDGVVIHVYLVYALGLLFTLAPLCLSAGAGRVAPGFVLPLRLLALIWALSSPVFFFMPDGWDGIYERGLGLLAFVIVGTVALLLCRGADAMDPGRPARATRGR